MTRSPPLDDLKAVSPALAAYTAEALVGDVWARKGLSKRDRSLVTVASQIARGQTVELAHQVATALDNDVSATEISEVVAHLAFYSGWANAVAAVFEIGPVFISRGVLADQLPVARPALLPIDQAAEDQRAATVQQTIGPVSASLVDDTGDLLFKNLLLRPDLAPRDRSLITVAALIAGGQTAQIPFHLNRAMDNGLTRTEASELLSHLAFNAGWPNAMSAAPVFKTVFDARA